MAFQKLTKTAACSTGRDLWILPDVEHSPWTRKIDWYLNLRMAHARVHKRLAQPEPLQKILVDNEIHLDESYLSSGSPLMIASKGRLPNKQTVELPYTGDPQQWLRKAHQVWSDLGCPPLRLFLPSEVSESQLSKAWPVTEVDVDVVYGDTAIEA